MIITLITNVAIRGTLFTSIVFKTVYIHISWLVDLVQKLMRVNRYPTLGSEQVSPDG